jgi:protein TonB
MPAPFASEARTRRRSPLDDERPASRRGVLVAGAGAAAAHALLALSALWITSLPRPMRVERAEEITQMVDIVVDRPVPIAPPPKPEVTSAPPAAHVPRARSVATPRAAAAPAAAQAGQVLTRDPAADVLDFGDTFVVGDGASHAGGTTESGGTGQQAVRDARARAGGLEGGTGTDTSGVDRSRVPVLAGGARWDCPFPEEADAAGIEAAVVGLEVRVAADGRVESVTVSRDPGNGFGREARRCAMSKRWSAGLDRAGNPIAMTTAVNVRFER